MMKKLEEKGYLGGLPLSDREILWCATEKNTKEEMDQLTRDFKGGVPEMKLIFEKSVEGRGADILPQETICQVNFDGQVRSVLRSFHRCLSSGEPPLLEL